MNDAQITIDVPEALQMLDAAHQRNDITESAVGHIREWLAEPRYERYRTQVLRHIEQGMWKKLDDVFWTIIPFGTGGRRGRMYEIGCNAINDRTIGESAQGLADYVVDTVGSDEPLACAIAYDTRHRSRHFAELCAGIMVAAGFKVYFLDEFRATPQLSYAVRKKNCHCGIMVTASHNPPSDNAVKVYWSTGGQVLPPHDSAIIERVMRVQEIRSTPFAEALRDGKVIICTEEIDRDYFEVAAACSLSPQRDVRILYTPLHGVGGAAVLPLLEKVGFQQVELYEPHAEPSGDFPNVPGHVSNPENTAVFEAPIEYAREQGHDLILATDPDCDRVGCAAPLTRDSSGYWGTLNGNQIGAVLTDYVLRRHKASGTIPEGAYVVKTLVTTELVRRIAESYGVDCEGNLLVGFKYIAGTMDARGPERFLFGTEESHGYLVGQYARDKDGAVACMLMSELAADLKAADRSLHEYLAGLERVHGCHSEHLINVMMEGSEGMVAMQRLMGAFRQKPPEILGGLRVAAIRDYLNGTLTPVDGSSEPLDGPAGNLVILDLDEPGNYVAVRPSGTEPKVKFYLFTALPPAEDVEAARKTLKKRLGNIEVDIRAFAKQQG